jgi:hypothetical protein
MGATTESQRRIDALGKALKKMKSSTTEACICCDQLTKRARQLDSLTSPASDASSLLSKASNNLGSTLVLMNEAREKFDTIRDCEPAIERLKRGVVQMQNEKAGKAKKARRNPFEDGEKDSSVVLSEQDVYAAADSMEIIRDAYDFFIERKHWRSTAAALASLERVHQMGVSSMCILASFHLLDSGQAVRIKRVVKQEGEAHITPATETAEQVSTTSVSFLHWCMAALEIRVLILSSFLLSVIISRLESACRQPCKIETCYVALVNMKSINRSNLVWSENCVVSLRPWVAMATNWDRGPRTNLLVWPITLAFQPTESFERRRLDPVGIRI